MAYGKVPIALLSNTDLFTDSFLKALVSVETSVISPRVIHFSVFWTPITCRRVHVSLLSTARTVPTCLFCHVLTIIYSMSVTELLVEFLNYMLLAHVPSWSVISFYLIGLGITYLDFAEYHHCPES